jgi:fucokinase
MRNIFRISHNQANFFSWHRQFEYGGAVACLAVLVDGKRPLKAHCRMVRGDGCITLRTESRNLSDEKLLSSRTVKISTLGDLAVYRNPEADCSLLMCALIQLGLVTPDSIRSDCHAPLNLMTFCQTDQADIGLEIIAQSLLPTGSGMGSSSIIGGCIISAIAKCVGIVLSGIGDTPGMRVEINGPNSLIHSVMMLEQLLTTGGGWQDNIGGIVGGLKLGSSDARVLPLQTKVQRVILSPQSIEALNQRLVLAFSGQPRLAKNILQQVLRRWATRSREIMTTVEGLVKGASDAIACVEAGDIDGLGLVMNQYWKFKMAMAGPESGAEPVGVHTVIDLLLSNGDIVGATLCGAGGGGFLVMLASKGLSAQDIEYSAKASGLDLFSWHSCTISEKGLVVAVVDA